MTTPEYAGFWRRTFASLLDTLWIGLILSLIIMLLNYDKQNILAQLLQEDEIAWQMILLYDVLPVLAVLFFWIRYAATPGKILCDCEIVDANTGQSITAKQAIIRYFGYFLSLLLIGAGFIMIAFDKRKQGLHDKLAGTVVVIHDESAVPLSQLLKECC